MSSKSFCEEGTYSYYAYLSKFEGWKGHHILSDGGPIFGVSGDDIFDSLVVDGRATFTPPVCGSLATNAGNLYPRAKAAWRQQRDGDSSVWGRSLVLVHGLYLTPDAQSVRKWWVHMLCGRKPTVEGVANLLSRREHRENAKHKTFG